MKHTETHMVIPLDNFKQLVDLITQSYGDDQDHLILNAIAVDLSEKAVIKRSKNSIFTGDQQKAFEYGYQQAIDDILNITA